MKKISFKNGLLNAMAIAFAIAFILTGCRFGTRTQDRLTSDTRTSSPKETQSKQNTPDADAPKSWNPYTDASPVKLVPLDTKIQLDKNTLSYGKLQITLPDNVTIEEQKSENDTRVIDFIGMEKSENVPFPPRVRFAHYRAEYQDKWELAGKLLDLLPVTALRFYDKAGDNLHYLFTYKVDTRVFENEEDINHFHYLFTRDKPCQNGYVMVYGNDICIVEEIASESDYSFGSLLVSDKVHWENSIQQLDVRGGSIVPVDLCKIKPDNNCTLFVKQSVDKEGTRKISLFQDGSFAAPVIALSFAECPSDIIFEDYNFDGCLDMIVPYQKIYLWNADKKTYEATQQTKDFLECSSKERYPETQTVWGYKMEFAEDAYKETSRDCVDHIEIFWKWEGTALVKKRECVTQVREENVRIFAYEDNPQKLLFDEAFTVTEWEENSAAVQKRYQQFYAGMIPKEGAKTLHKIDSFQEPRQYIPQTLLDKITKAMLDNTVPETLAELQIDTYLTNDVLCTIAKDNLEMRNDVVGAWRIEPETRYVMDAVDGDNDGIMDLIGVAYYDGYGNSTTDVVFYQGQTDGTYQKTQSSSYRAEQVAALFYEGNTYLCQIHYGYEGKKSISLACYVDGAIAETVYLTFVLERYEVRLAECAERRYQALAEEILKNSISYKEKTDKHEITDGSSEERIATGEYEYQCDLNNDDGLEQYYKSFLFRDWEYLDFGGEGKGIEPVSEIVQSESAAMMWVEPFENRNIVHILSLTGWKDFEITGYLINDMEYKQVYRITADAVAGVRKERYALN